MFLSRHFKAMVSWMACLAILLSALAPAISHAVQRDAPEGWVEICSVTGAKMVRVDDASTPKPGTEESQSHVFKHCPYCSVHTDALGLPPAPPASLALMSLDTFVPALFLLAPRTLFAWASAQPRAPPLKS